MDDAEHSRQQPGGSFSGRENEALLGRAHAEGLFESAAGRVEEVVDAVEPNANGEERSAAIEDMRAKLEGLLESPSLKLVRLSRSDGSRVETVEPEDSETPVDGIPLAAFSRLFGVDEHAGEDELLEVLTSASGKRFRILEIEPDQK